MSTPNTHAELQTAISTHIDFSSTAPTEGSEDYNRRKELLNQAANKWARLGKWRWKELYTTATLTTTASQTYIDMPSDYQAGSLVVPSTGNIKIGSTYFRFVNIDEEQDYVDTYPKVFVYGNKAQGYKLDIEPTPTGAESGDIIYYSSHLATDTDGTSQANLSASTDKTKCPDGMYLVYWVLAVLYGTDETNPSLSTRYGNWATDRLADMLMEQKDINQKDAVTSFADDAGYPALGT